MRDWQYRKPAYSKNIQTAFSVWLMVNSKVFTSDILNATCTFHFNEHPFAVNAGKYSKLFVCIDT